MDKELAEKSNQVFLDLEHHRIGSVQRAQKFVKTLRQLGEKHLATQLVKQINKNAALMPRDNW